MTTSDNNVGQFSGVGSDVLMSISGGQGCAHTSNTPGPRNPTHIQTEITQEEFDQYFRDVMTWISSLFD